MLELADFLTKVNQCDLIVLTSTTERAYCRFFCKGLYIDRMYVHNKDLLAALLPLVGEGDEIDATGIVKLKQLYLAI